MAIQSEPILTALHYLFSHSGEKVIAHCLDLDLVTSGQSVDDAEDRLNAIVLAQIGTCFVSGNFGQLRFKAPSEYWQSLSDATELGRVHLEVEVPPVVLPVKRCVVTLPVYRHETRLELQAA